MKTCWAICLLIMALGCMSYAQDKNGEKKQRENRDSTLQVFIYKERIKLKNMAFCTCLYKSLPEADSILIKDGSGAAYVELGAYGIDAYIKVNDYAETYSAQTQYHSKYNKTLSVMKCLDFYNSPELDSLVRSLDAELDTSQLAR